MATVNKDFKIKSGLIVEGTTATVNGFDVLTKAQAGQDYILNLTGGATLVKSVESTQLDVTVGGKLSVKSGVFDASGSAAAAQSAAASDATTKANAAQTAATSAAAADATTKANAAQSAATSAAATDATTKANAAQAAAQAFATSADTAVRTAVTTEIGTAISTEVTNRNSAISSAVSTEVTNRNSAITSAIATEVTNRNSAITTAVAAVVDSAPAALDTLNELASALANSPDTVSNLTTLVGTKAPLASPALTGTPTAPTAAVGTNTTQVATTAYAKAAADAAQSAAASDATTKANAARTAAEATAASDATSKVAAEATARNTAIATAISTEVSNRNTAITSAVDAINTDVIEEGTSNKYFTDARAKASAADLLTGATKTNITITGSGSGLVITAENGVADSTTSDLTEGSNLYFTNARAVSAVQAVVPNFTAVELNSVAKQVAATLSAPTAGVQTAHAFAKADYRSAEYLVKVAYGTHTEISKVLLTLDSSDNIAITEYGMVGTNGSLSVVSAAISGSNVQLLVTTANNNSTVTVMGTLLK